jgi:hypothetical protein
MKSNKEKLIENFRKVNKINLNENALPYTDHNDNYSNEELRSMIDDLLFDLRFYRHEIASKIIAATLEEKFPVLKVQ